MQVSQVIAAHTNTDFDALAGAVAAARLYPRARICLSGALNQNVRRFAHLYGDRFGFITADDIEPEAVERLILIETAEANRLGELGPLLKRPGIDVVVFDHHDPLHADAGTVPGAHVISTDDGAVTTLLLRILAERAIQISPLEATVFALGIHEDTGSLTFTTTTERDAEALAFCMQRGASAALIERFLHHPLSRDQRELLARSLQTATPVPGIGENVLIAALSWDRYVEEIAVIAHRFIDVTGADAFILVLGMEARVFVVARSRLGGVDVAAALQPVGGGGHPAAASAVVRDRDPQSVADTVATAVRHASEHGRRAADLVSRPAALIDLDDSIDHALILCHREDVAGALVVEDGLIVGSVGEDDLRRAAGHGLGHAPVKAVMSRTVPAVSAATPAVGLAEQAAGSPTGHLVVHRAGQQAPLHAGDVLGLVRGRDVLGMPAEADRRHLPEGPQLARRLAELGLDDLFEAIQALATSYQGVYLVGGAVRDVLLRERTFDIDIAVEGDGIAFAHQLARRLGGHVRAHPKFRTAVVIAGEEGGGEALRVDVASTRTELYDYPAALPRVEPAPLRSDLARRDFTINAMAVSLSSEDYGTLYDPFGGLQDLAARRLAVLHNLSFIEDPTRIFRGVRYETRYGFRMDARTIALARACSEMELVGDLSSARLRDELVLILRERSVEHALRRLQELRLDRVVHPGISGGQATRELIRATDTLWLRHGLVGEMPLWRLRLALMLRDVEPAQILEWADRMRIRRTDAGVLARAFVVGRLLLERVRTSPADADVHDAAGEAPLEAVLVAMTLDRGGAVARRLAVYLDRLRHVRLEVDGADLRQLGYAESPAIGRVLASLLRLKIGGILTGGRDAELAAAQRMLDAVEQRGAP
jgi:tRNA nucleotidyltransferase (CCA-adding enzyme)